MNDAFPSPLDLDSAAATAAAEPPPAGAPTPRFKTNPTLAQSALRDEYYAVLERFAEWCTRHGDSLYVELRRLCQLRMGEPLTDAPPSQGPSPKKGGRGTPRGSGRPRVGLATALAVTNARGDRYRSVLAAARAWNVPHGTLRTHLKTGREYCGTTWSYAPRETAPEEEPCPA